MLNRFTTRSKPALLGATVALAGLLSVAGAAYADGVPGPAGGVPGPVPVPSSTAAPSPTASSAPTPTSTPTPTPTPTDGTVVLAGVYGTAATGNCNVFRTFDNEYYMLDLPMKPTPDQKDLFLPGLPLNVPVQITVLPEPEKVASCVTGAHVAVLESYAPTNGIELTGVYTRAVTNICNVFQTSDNRYYILELPENPTVDQRYLFSPGLPLNVPVQITVVPEFDKATACMVGVNVAILESYSPLS